MGGSMLFFLVVELSTAASSAGRGRDGLNHPLSSPVGSCLIHPLIFTTTANTLGCSFPVSFLEITASSPGATHVSVLPGCFQHFLAESH